MKQSGINHCIHECTVTSEHTTLSSTVSCNNESSQKHYAVLQYFKSGHINCTESITIMNIAHMKSNEMTTSLQRGLMSRDQEL